MNQQQAPTEATWNTGSHADFFHYYEQQSAGKRARERFLAIQDTILRLLDQPKRRLDVADIGCGAGTQSRLWAARGHRVVGADINQDLIALARARALDEGAAIRFEVASATSLPWPDQSMDVCIAPELLEHVENWQVCLNECVRILRPGGVLYISTSNKLCPIQEEFQLPLYSWYPRPWKRYFEQLARTTRPSLAAYATYPAVNWFSFYSLRDYLAQRGLMSMDRFDMIDLHGKPWAVRRIIALLRTCAPLRFLGHVATSYTMVLAVKPRA